MFMFTILSTIFLFYPFLVTRSIFYIYVTGTVRSRSRYSEGLDRPGFDFRERNFFCPAGIGGYFPGVKRPGNEANLSPSSSVEINKMFIYMSTPPPLHLRGAVTN
jgi:hypothetical protein